MTKKKVALLIQGEIENILQSFKERVDLLLSLWSKHRKREPFLRSLKHHFHEISPKALLLLDSKTVLLCRKFFKEIDDLILYIEFTEDMVIALEDRIKKHMKSMDALTPDLFRQLLKEQRSSKKKET